MFVGAVKQMLSWCLLFCCPPPVIAAPPTPPPPFLPTQHSRARWRHSRSQLKPRTCAQDGTITQTLTATSRTMAASRLCRRLPRVKCARGHCTFRHTFASHLCKHRNSRLFVESLMLTANKGFQRTFTCTQK